MLMQIETIPEEIFKKFIIYLNQRDMEKLLSLFTEDATIWGTGKDEYRIGKNEIRAQFERDWSEAASGHLEMSRNVHSSIDGRSWGSCEFMSKFMINGEEHVFPHLRASIFLEEEDGKMKIAHLHSSFADPMQEEGKSFRG